MRKYFQEEIEKINDKPDLVAMIEEMVDSVPISSEEFIDTINTLWKARKRSGWGVGAMLARLDRRLKDDYKKWIDENKSRADFKKLMGDNIDKSEIPIKSLNEWFEKHGESVDISYPQARLCISLFEGTTKEIGDELGTKKYAIVRTLPEPVREKVIQEIIVNDLDAERAKDLVEKTQNRLDNRDAAKTEREKTIKKVNRQIMIDIIVDDDRLADNEILLKCGSEEEKDLLNEALDSVIEQIKLRMYSQIK